MNCLNVVLVYVLFGCYDELKEIPQYCPRGQEYEVSLVDRKNSSRIFKNKVEKNLHKLKPHQIEFTNQSMRHKGY